MKIKSLLLLFLLSATTVQAQTTLLGITAGQTHTNVEDERNQSALGARDGYTAGITFQHFFLRRFSLGADLLYSQRGFTDNIAFTTSGGRSRSSTSATTNYDYLSLPLKVGVKFGRKFYFFVNAGLVPAVLLSAEATRLSFDANGNFLESPLEKVTSQTSRFDMGGLLEGGLGARLTKEIRLAASLFYQESFSPTTQTYSSNKSSVNHYGIGFLVGLKYKLPQRAQPSEAEETIPQ